MTAKETIAILGCGWLGLPLAKSLIAKGFRVKGSTTRMEKLPKLTEAGIEPYLLKINGSGVYGDLNTFLEGADILIINIPPQDKIKKKPAFLKFLVGGILSADIRRVIFVSSTSLYKDTAQFSSYDGSPFFEISQNAFYLWEVENIFKSLVVFYDVETAVVRFGGLIGPERHPVHHLAGKEGIANPDAPVNLIDQKDCIGIIEAIVEKGAFMNIFNAVYPYHPSRKEYYTSKAKELGLPIPQFREGPSVGKIIESGNVEAVLGYKFQVRP